MDKGEPMTEQQVKDYARIVFLEMKEEKEKNVQAQKTIRS